MRHLSFLLAPVCATWLGCAGGEPGTSPSPDTGQSPVKNSDNPNTGDGTWMGEPLAEGCAPDGGTPTGDTVFVTNTTRFITATGVVERSEPMSTGAYEVLVPNGATFTRILGTATDGGIQFTGVPSGPYYLRAGTTHVVTDERHVDVGNNRLGRADTVFSEIYETPVQVNLVNLAPWAPWQGSSLPGSSLQVASRQVDLYGGVDVFDMPYEGHTNIVSANANLWSGTGFIPVFEADKGDRLVVNQLSPMDAGTLPDGGALAYTTVVRSVEMGAFDFTPDGVTSLPITGVMQPVRMGEFPIEWRLPRYAALATDVHPSATPSIPSFYVTPAAHGLQHGWVGYSGELLSLQLPRGVSTQDFTRRLTYGNPYPSSWDMVAMAQHSFRTLQTIPDGTGTAFYVTGSVVTYDRLDNLVAGPVEPRVSPPRELSIDGVPASVPREVGSASPVISWRAPSLGSPSAYQVSFYRVESPDGFPTAGIYRRLYAPGSATQVRVPPGTLAPGGTYFVRVAAVVSPGYDVERKPFVFGEPLPFYYAEAVSSLFTTP
ncbi:fibronectin type III domain-containing protein [Pyxidicoccus fallax]|nr:fibronectin type III domain-containing protein [Pyxidicoccus fallax]